jgi:hypothetical protein
MRRCLWAVVVLILLFSSSAHATPPVPPPDRFTFIHPVSAQGAQLVEARFQFEIGAQDPFSARVSATYTVSNPTNSSKTVTLAVPYSSYQGEQARPEVVVDGQPVNLRRLSRFDLLRPLVDEWFRDHPGLLEAAAKRPGDDNELFRAMRAEGITETDPVWLSHLREYARNHSDTSILNLGTLLVPKQKQEIWQKWFPGVPYRNWLETLEVLEFDLTLPAVGRKDVQVLWTQRAEAYKTFRLLVSPAREWQIERPLQFAVQVSEPAAVVDANVPLARAQQQWLGTMASSSDEFWFSLEKQPLPSASPKDQPGLMVWLGLLLALAGLLMVIPYARVSRKRS